MKTSEVLRRLTGDVVASLIGLDHCIGLTATKNARERVKTETEIETKTFDANEVGKVTG
jgi:hypothetical protein